jgi:hypothetical protein|tara:strand:- start:534 stop:758 length:225 start_codon:yes stop_codon:yes gene_type:complete
MIDWDRHKRQNTEPPTWIEWQPANPFRYLFLIVLCILVLPSLFGLILTPLGALFNILFVDWVFYKRETQMINHD